MRKLVTVRQVDKILPIFNADNIEIAIVDGWQCIIKKEQKIKEKDFILFFEIDSVLNKEDSRFDFMSNSKWRVKTIKLRGQISQGLLMSLSILTQEENNRLVAGEDLADILGVELYDPEKHSKKKVIAGNQAGFFPQHTPRTDQERIQNLTNTIPNYHWNNFFITEKLDGTSFTCFLNFDEEGNPDFGICSRNWRMKHDGSSVYSQITTNYDLETKMIEQNRALAIQGEIIGPGIQKNHYKLQDIELRVFAVYDIINRKYLNFDIVQGIAFSLGLETVPLVDINTNWDFNLTNILQVAEGNSVLNPETSREGLVFHSKINDFSFKAISNNWLLKNQ